MRTVKISGVDVVHPARNGLLQHGNRFLDISGRPPDQLVSISARKLHGAISHSVQIHSCPGECEAAGKLSLLKHSVPPGFLVHLRSLDEGSFRFGLRIMSIHTITAFEPRKTPIQVGSTVRMEALAVAAV